MFFLIFIILSSLICFVILLRLFLIRYSPTPRPSFPAEQYYEDPFSREKRPFPSITDDDGIDLVDLSLVFPAFRESRRLPPVLASTVEYLESRERATPGFTWEIIVVDDGSADGGQTYEIGIAQCQRLGIQCASSHNIRVCQLQKNRGKGGAVTQGVLRSRGRKILFLDADGATDITCCERLEAVLDHQFSSTNHGENQNDAQENHDHVNQNNHNQNHSNMKNHHHHHHHHSNSIHHHSSNDHHLGVAVGSRTHLQTNSGASRHWLRLLLMHLFHAYITILGIRGISDTQCGFKMFTRSAARLIFPNMHVEGFIFDIEILLLAQSLSIPIFEVPVRWEEKDGSTLNLVQDSFRMARDLLIIRLNYFLRVWLIPSK